jgi:hypothetical protein
VKDYPRLREMGVLHPEHIVHWSVNSIAYTDVLRIVYERPKGSILPQTRTYKFPRVQKTATINPASSKTDTVMETAPALTEALAELTRLMETRERKGNVADAIAEELRLLEEDIQLRTAYIRELVGKLKNE